MEGTPQPSGPSQTRCCPLNLQVLPSQGYPFAPTSPAGPLNLYPPSLPWLTSSRLQRDCSLIHRTSPDLSGRSCSPRALPFSPRPPNRAPLVSPSSPIAALRTPPPTPPGCGAPGLGSRQGKFLRPGPARGRLLSPPLREGAGIPQPACPTASSAASGDAGLKGCLSFSAARGWWREVRGLCGQAGTLRASGRPLCAELSW